MLELKEKHSLSVKCLPDFFSGKTWFVSVILVDDLTERVYTYLVNKEPDIYMRNDNNDLVRTGQTSLLT